MTQTKDLLNKMIEAGVITPTTWEQVEKEGGLLTCCKDTVGALARVLELERENKALLESMELLSEELEETRKKKQLFVMGPGT